jgi:cytochrome c biogenesis protein CcmG/thiol:disulfide interchange protein DsbE
VTAVEGPRPQVQSNPMMRVVAVLAALSIIGFVVYVMAAGFGTDPHEVPFMMKGKPAPRFVIKRLDQEGEIKLADYIGQPIVLNFWATWCGPCKVEQPVLDWAAEQYKGKAVFIGIVFEDTEQNTRGFLQQNGAVYPQVYDPKSTVAVDYAVSGVPETYFINREGIIVKKYIYPFQHPSQFEEQIAEILK